MQDITGLTKTYATLLEKVSQESPFMANHIEEVRKVNRHKQYFGLSEGRAFMEALLNTGTAGTITEGQDIGRNPELLWTLAGYMRNDPDPEKSAVGLHGLASFYKTSFEMGFIGPEFDNYRLAMRDHVRKRGLLREFLENEFERVEDTYTITYARGLFSAIVTLHYRGHYLQDITVRHFDTTRRKTMRSKNHVAFIVHEAGAWLDAQGEPINSHRDLTAKRLQQAIDHYREVYSGDRLCDALRYLFDIYKLAITENPEYAFFADSYLWCKEMVFDFQLPMELARGYQIVPSGITEMTPPYEKVLFCFQHKARKFANSHRFSALACDFSMVKTDLYRSIVINFGAQNECRHFNSPRSFFPWLEERKMRQGTYETTLTHVNRTEALAFRAYIFRKFPTPETRNSNLGTAKAILKWASDKRLLTVEPTAWEAFKWSRTSARTKKSNARCLTDIELTALEETLEKMAESDVKALMALYVFRIQLFTDTRPNEICDMNLDNLHLNPDGTAVYFAIEKNSGSDVVEIRYTPTATQAILDAIDATAEIRAQCPLNCTNRLFLYDAGYVRSHEYQVLSIDAYNTQLRKASKIAGLGISVVSSYIRDTYMTSIQRFCHEHGLTDLQRMVLTKHNRKTTINNYLDINKSDFLTKANRMTFGKLLKK